MIRGPSSVRKLLKWCGEKRGLFLLFEPRDMWIGIYWKLDCTHGHVYLCILPMLPILFTWVRGKKNYFDEH